MVWLGRAEALSGGATLLKSGAGFRSNGQYYNVDLGHKYGDQDCQPAPEIQIVALGVKEAGLDHADYELYQVPGVRQAGIRVSVSLS